MWTKTVEGIDDINAYTGDSVYVNAGSYRVLNGISCSKSMSRLLVI